MKANTEPAESRETQIALYNEEPGTITREEAVSHWKACACRRIPCRIWQSGKRIKMTDAMARRFAQQHERLKGK